MLEEVPCNLCGDTGRVLLFRGMDRMYASVPDGVWCDVVRCRTCGLVYLSPRVDEGSIGLFYPENEYYAYRETPGVEGRLARLKREVFFAVARRYLGYPSDTATRSSDSVTMHALGVLAFKGRRARFRRVPPYVKGGRLLEFGFGSGDFLCRMRELGWECWGVERNAAACATLSSLGVRALETIDDPAIPEGYFDHVTSYHAIEHVYDPRAILRRMHAILKPGGQIFCGVPNFHSLLGRVFGPYWDNLGVPIHPYVFTAASLKAFLEACGFSNVQIRYHSLPVGMTGSIQWLWNAGIWRLTGRKYVSTSLRNSRALRAVVAPAVRLLDTFHLGDCIEATATKA